MKITLLNDDVGTTEAGQWVQRNPAGGWLAIDPPPTIPAKPPRPIVVIDGQPMADPYKRNPNVIPTVTVRRVIERTVTDFEAEVLIRNGWEVVK